MKQSKKSLGMKISAFVLSFAMVCTLLAGVNVVAFAADQGEVESTPVFCAYNQNNGEHFFTTNEAEYNHLVELTWGAEGEKWQAPVKSKSPIFRLYNQNSGEHYFTLDANEAKSLASIGWNDEGIGLYSDDEKATPVYCMYNPNAKGQFEAGAHHYTKDAAEAAHLESIGWTWTNDGQAAFYGVKEEEPQILVKITKAEQKSANTVEVTFDQSAIGLVEKSDIVVAKANGSLVLPANSMEFAEDGMSAVLTLAIPLEDQVDYTVTLNESEAGFTASLGAPAYVTVSTASAQKGVVTPIEFAIYDSKGIDVTSTVDVDATCTVEVDGDDIVSDTSVASKSTVTMNTVGETANVVVTYEDPEGVAADIVGKGTITCIPAEAVVGTPIYYECEAKDEGSLVSPNNKMAKFYLGKMASGPITVAVGEQSDTVYFCAANASDFTVYSYDEYELDTSDGDVMTVSDNILDGGKQVAFTVSGNNVGNANVVVKATVNDVDTYYNIPVRVVKKGTLSTISYTVDRTSMTNAMDGEYFATSEIEAYDSNGEEITDRVTCSYEVTSGTEGYDDGKGIDTSAADMIAGLPTTDQGFVKTENPDNTVKFTAWGAKSGKRTIKATVSEGTIDKSKSISIQVNAISGWNNATDTGSEQKVTYQVEMSKSSIFTDFDDLAEDAQGVTARLYATVGGKFVGYVRPTMNGTYAIGTPSTGSAITVVKPNDESTIARDTLHFGTMYGSKYNVVCSDMSLGYGAVAQGLYGVTKTTYTGTIKDLYASTQSAISVGYAARGMTLLPLAVNPFTTADQTLSFYADAPEKMAQIARSGKYTPTFVWKSVKDVRDRKDTLQKAQATLTVGTLVEQIASAEKVTVTSRNVESLDVDSIKDNLYAIADMNNNEGDNSVLDDVGLANADFRQIVDGDTPGTGIEDLKGFVQYAVVHEQVQDAVYNDAGVKQSGKLFIDFYVPIAKTFRAS